MAFWIPAPLYTWGDFLFSVAPDFIHFLLIADGMEEQYSSIPPFNASAATPADVYKLDDSILFKFQIMYKMFVIVIFSITRFLLRTLVALTC